MFKINCKTLYTEADVKPYWQKRAETEAIDNLAPLKKKIPHFYLGIDCNNSLKAAEILQEQYKQGQRDFVLEMSVDARKNMQDSLINKVNHTKNMQNYEIDFAAIFGNIDLSKLCLNIRSDDSFDALILARNLVEFCQKNNFSCQRLDIDIETELLKEIHQQEYQKYFDNLINQLPQIATISATKGVTHQIKAATEPEQIAFIIAEMLEKLRKIEKINDKWEIYSPKLRMIVPVDQKLYYNIAKIRALRKLWKFIVSKCKSINSNQAPIYALADRSMFTRFDLVSNILRLNTACCSALLANVEHIELPAFTTAFGELGKQASNARRNSLTTPLIAWHEANIGQIADPMAGSYMIESLSEEIAEKAYQILQKIEKNGGYQKFIKTKYSLNMQNKNIAENKKMLSTRKKILIGVNHFAKVNETMPQMEHLFDKYPIKNNNDYYPSLDFELLRQRVGILAAKKQKPILPLATEKNLMKSANNLVANILACAGLEAKLTFEYQDIKNMPVIIYDHENNATIKHNKLIKKILSHSPKTVFYLMGGKNDRKITNSRLPIISSYLLEELDIIAFLNDLICFMER